MGLKQKRIPRLLVDLGEISQLKPNTHTQLSGHEPGATGKSGVADKFKVKLALPHPSAALTDSQKQTALDPLEGYDKVSGIYMTHTGN